MASALELGRKAGNLVWEVYGPLIPTSKKKKNEFLDLVREKVEIYQPLIEEKTGVELGKINVKDNKYALSDVTSRMAHQNAIKDAWRQGRIPNELDFKVSFMRASTCELMAFIPVKIIYEILGVNMKYWNNTIYVPFGLINRVDVDFKERKEHLDKTVVHELSHGLWYRLGGKESEQCSGDWRIWNEGFATYCEDEYFKKFYPEGKREKEKNHHGIYKRGKAKVERLVSQSGEEVVLEIPRNWEKFDFNEKLVEEIGK